MPKKWLYFLFAVQLICVGPVPGSTAEIFNSSGLFFNPAEMKTRVFPFNKDFSIGQLFFGPGPDTSLESMQMKAAQGVVTVPAGKYVIFSPSRRFYANPASIKALPAGSIDCLMLSSASMDDSEDGLCDRALAYIGNLKGVIFLNLDRSDASDQGAVHAAKLDNLQKISALATMVEGKCFKQFGKLTKLRILYLGSSPIKDESLSYLPAIKNLEFLNLSSTPVSDKGVENLSACRSLLELNLLNDRMLTDRCVPAISAMKRLRFLNLGGTSISSKGVLQLKGLPLWFLTLPEKSYSKAELKKFEQAFPRAKIVVWSRGLKPVSAEDKAIFAPLH